MSTSATTFIPDAGQAAVEHEHEEHKEEHKENKEEQN